MKILIPIFVLCCLAGCNKEINVVKIDEKSNGKTVQVPNGYRLSILLQTGWGDEIKVDDVQGIKLLGSQKQEFVIDGRNTQFLSVTFSVRASGLLKFRYNGNGREFSVNIQVTK